jgi:uncharacterized protein with PQ loop repeat
MGTHSGGLRHYHLRKRIHKKHEPYPHPDRLKRFFDRVIYVVVILGPVMNLPQLFKIWIYRDATGVSFVSWTGFTIFSVIWFIYGVLHREKPIIFMNVFIMVIQALIAMGSFLYGSGF